MGRRPARGWYRRGVHVDEVVAGTRNWISNSPLCTWLEAIAESLSSLLCCYLCMFVDEPVWVGL
jgi:hypothetical protein